MLTQLFPCTSKEPESVYHGQHSQPNKIIGKLISQKTQWDDTKLILNMK